MDTCTYNLTMRREHSQLQDPIYELFRVGTVVGNTDGVRLTYGQVDSDPCTRLHGSSDERFTEKTLRPDDLIVVSSTDTTPRRITAVFREDIQVFPPNPDPSL